ncbi:MAG TPA: phosphate ABC transporter permease subunit PstC, partial [Acidimicrobiales bacterium]|nr:phosphate ABC transporter permease subunit PstC [Acidimicrobiales bacterium]
MKFARSWGRFADGSAKWGSGLLALIPFASLVVIIVALLIEALPAIRVNGIGFITGSTWSMGREYGVPIKTHGVSMLAGESYGAWPLILGTLESSLIALVIAVPVSLAAALVVVEKLPTRLSRWVGSCLEVLVGIPSVVYGLWGALTLGPFLAHHLSGIASHIPNVPVLRFFRGPTYNGEGLLTSGVVLGIMIIPIIASTSRDLIRQVPSAAKDGARALGMTDAEIARKVIWPWARTGIVGASVLGLGRALGETMAVAMTSGAVLGTTAHSLFSNMNTIAATIVSQLDSANSDG